ncbi:MAG: hypothetical protein E6I60_16150 [Chloroflexi bacterium]|nr:MAG: hypothetical protein E6I60_16150 [Chloroflexota bacterium]
MVNIADVVVGRSTDQQAHALPAAVTNWDDLPYRVEAVVDITVGSVMFVMRSVSLGSSSSFLATAGDAILGGRTFNDDSAEAVREAREQRQ